MPHEPTRGDILFGLLFSLGGLVFLLVALAIRGLPQDPSMLAVVYAAAIVFGGSTLRGAQRLRQCDKDE